MSWPPSGKTVCRPRALGTRNDLVLPPLWHDPAFMEDSLSKLSSIGSELVTACRCNSRGFARAVSLNEVHLVRLNSLAKESNEN